MSIADLITRPVMNMANSIRAPAPVKKAQWSGLLRGDDTRRYGVGVGSIRDTQAMRLSAVYAAVNIRSDDMSVLPPFVMDRNTREHVDHNILELLAYRPNEAMTRTVQNKLLEQSVLLTGNAYEWIIRDGMGRPVELVPVTGDLVNVWVDDRRRPWYDIINPVTGDYLTLPNEDICHYKGPSRNGYEGESVLSYARDCIRSGLAAQDYNAAFYESGCHLSGALSMEGDLSGFVKDKDGKYTDVSMKDYIREEWSKVYSGPTNAHKVAVLDHGMKYQPLTVSQADAQFIQQMEATVEDIGRFFGVPLYKLQAGKQSYNANEQNAIEYMKILQPRVTQMEEERTYKLLSPTERRSGLEIRYNMRALMRADDKNRAEYYSKMMYAGYSVNDILRLEDMPDKTGGDVTFASLNYVPLDLFRELSKNRNGAGGDNNG